MPLPRLNRCKVVPGVALLTSLFGWPHTLAAQPEPSSTFVAIALGISSTKRSEFFDPFGLAFDVSAGRALRQNRHLSLVGVANGGGTSTGGHDASCAIVLSSNGHTYCEPVGPTYQYLGAMLGLINNSRPFELDALVGPAYVHSSCACGANPDSQFGGSTFGIQMRAEASVHAAGPLWFTVAGQNLVIPRLGGRMLRAQGVSVGMRVF